MTSPRVTEGRGEGLKSERARRSYIMGLRENTEREAILSRATDSALEEACQSGAAAGREEFEAFIRRVLDGTVRISIHRKEPEFDPKVAYHMFSRGDRSYSLKIGMPGQGLFAQRGGCHRHCVAL